MLVFKNDGLLEFLADDGLDPVMACFIGDGIGVAGCFPRSSSVDNLCLSPPSPRVSKHV